MSLPFQRTASLVAVLLLLLIALIASLPTDAYSVSYTTYETNNGLMDFEGDGFCKPYGSHTMMPHMQSFQKAAVEAFDKAHFTEAPIAATAKEPACLDEKCTWRFNNGIFWRNQSGLFFYNGVVYKGGQLKGKPVPGMYNNFIVTEQPLYWENTSYWGARQVYMKKDHHWANTNVVTYWKQWVCEVYHFQKSDSVLFPTYPNGDPIPYQSNSSSPFYHCGKKVKLNDKGKWIDHRCGSHFPWWAGLVIAVVALIILVAVIIIIWCCCCMKEHKAEVKKYENVLSTREDNPNHIPSQSDIGRSRCSGSFVETREEYEEEDTQLYSVPSSRPSFSAY